MFVAFEGPEGSGKSTQVRLVSDVLRLSGFDVVTTREPGGTPLGESVRRLLLDSEILVSPEAEAYLMTGARAEHVHQVIKPALDRGGIVLSDRFYHSTLAYQGAGRMLDIATLRQMQHLAIGPVEPDIVVLIDIDVDAGLQRRRNHGHLNRLDREDEEFHCRVANWYRTTALKCPEWWIVFDGEQSPDILCRQISDALHQRIALLQAESPEGATL